MPIRVDFTNTKSKSFEALPTSVYPMVIAGFQIKESKSSEHPYIEWEFIVEGGDYNGRKIWYRSSLHPNVDWRLREDLKAFGVAEDKLAGQFEFDPADFVGTKLNVTVSQVTYNERLTNDVDAIELREASRTVATGRKIR